MTFFIIRRFLQMMIVLGIMSLVVFLLIGLMPGDPIDLMIAGNPEVTPEDAVRLREIHGLDQPLFKRYGHWLGSAIGGDLGYSRLYGVPVLNAILPRLLNTAVLMGSALLFTVMLAIPLGVYAAAKRSSMQDKLTNVFALAGLSAPPFWTGILFIYLFAAVLEWLPASADISNPISLLLPALSLSLASFAIYVRHTRSAMVNALIADHIKTARAKGCSKARTLWGHAFRNAAAPIVTVFMLDLGTLFGGAVTIETVFAYPGMGKLMFDAVLGNDFNLALAGFLVLSALVLFANFIADILYGVLDKRVVVA